MLVDADHAPAALLQSRDQVLTHQPGGAGDEVTLADNPRAWSRHRLAPRSMTDVSALDTRTTLLGLDLPHPVLIAPTATHVRYHPDAERETLRGAAASIRAAARA